MAKANSVEPLEEEIKQIEGRALRTVETDFDVNLVEDPWLKMKRKVKNYVPEHVLSEIENSRP